MNLPKARTTDIIEQEAGSELLVYDLQIDKAYNLNETSKIIYKACGNQTFEDLKRKYKFTDDLIYLTLDKLSANNLMEDYQSDHFAGLSRREVIRKVGLGSMIALPIMTAVFAPSAANAASAFAPGSRAFDQTCTTSTDCAASAPHCINTVNSPNDSQGTRCCGINSNTAVRPNNTEDFVAPGTCPGSCSNCQCAIDYCNANSAPCCSGTYASANYNGSRVFGTRIIQIERITTDFP